MASQDQEDYYSLGQEEIKAEDAPGSARQAQFNQPEAPAGEGSFPTTEGGQHAGSMEFGRTGESDPAFADEDEQPHKSLADPAQNSFRSPADNADSDPEDGIQSQQRLSAKSNEQINNLMMEDQAVFSYDGVDRNPNQPRNQNEEEKLVTTDTLADLDDMGQNGGRPSQDSQTRKAAANIFAGKVRKTTGGQTSDEKKAGGHRLIQ